MKKLDILLQLLYSITLIQVKDYLTVIDIFMCMCVDFFVNLVLPGYPALF